MLNLTQTFMYPHSHSNMKHWNRPHLNGPSIERHLLPHEGTLHAQDPSPEGNVTHPLGEKSMARAFLRWPSSSIRHFPERRSHTRPHASRPLRGRNRGRHKGTRWAHFANQNYL